MFAAEQNKFVSFLCIILFDLYEDLKSGSLSLYLPNLSLKDLSSLTLNSPAMD